MIVILMVNDCKNA